MKPEVFRSLVTISTLLVCLVDPGKILLYAEKHAPSSTIRLHRRHTRPLAHNQADGAQAKSVHLFSCKRCVLLDRLETCLETIARRRP